MILEGNPILKYLSTAVDWKLQDEELHTMYTETQANLS